METKKIPQASPRVNNLIPFPSERFLEAEGVLSLPQKSAYMLVTLALKDEKENVSIIDPFCGNGIILMSAGLHYPDRVCSLYGLDADENTAFVARLNLDEFMNYRTENGKEFPAHHVAHANSLNSLMPRIGDQTFVVTDLPWGKKSRFFDSEGRIAEPNYLPLFKNLRDHNISKLVVGVDSRMPLEMLENPQYLLERAESHRAMDFYVGKRK